jgi:EmrB/QacA subfamily drug resistance transporter
MVALSIHQDFSGSAFQGIRQVEFPTGPSAMSIEQNFSLTGRQRFHILFSLMFGIVMAPIDASMVNVILPTLTEVFSAELALAQWVPMIYLLIISSLLLFFGRLGDIWGYKKVFMSGLVCFVIASGLCGCSPTIAWLIAFRAVQGVGAAMMMAVPLALITACFPPEALGQALGTYSVSISAGLAIGPSVGGALASTLGWRVAFLINVPIGLAALLVAWKVLPNVRGEPGRNDYCGAFLSFVCLFCLLMCVNLAQNSGVTTESFILLVAFAAAGTAFFLVEKSRSQPMLDFGLFRNVTFAFASMSALLNFMAQYVVIFLTPFYLQRVFALPPARVGLIMTAFPLAVMAVAPLSGWLSDRIGSRLLSCLGSLVCAGAMVILSGLRPPSGSLEIAMKLALFGIGTGIFQSPNTSAAMGGVPRPHLGVASAVLSEMRNVGMVMGIGLAGLVLHLYVSEDVLSRYLPSASEAQAFVRGVEYSMLTGAVVACAGAIASLIKRSGTARIKGDFNKRVKLCAELQESTEDKSRTLPIHRA